MAELCGAPNLTPGSEATCVDEPGHEGHHTGPNGGIWMRTWECFTCKRIIFSAVEVYSVGDWRTFCNRTCGPNAVEMRIADVRSQVIRNGRWGTCEDCPQHDAVSWPEQCVNTERDDHRLPPETADELIERLEADLIPF